MTSTWTPTDLDPAAWKPEPGGWYQHTKTTSEDDAGTPWYQVNLPGIWHRLTHRCRAHSVGVYGWTVMVRCICGAVREGMTNPDSHFRQHNPGDQPMHVRFTESWRHRNSRYRGTALLYHPYVRPLVEAET